MTMPPRKKPAPARNPDTAIWLMPLKPWPLGQPPASLAPNMATMPPRKATTARPA